MTIFSICYTTFVLHYYIHAVLNFYAISVIEENDKVVFCLEVGVWDIKSSAVITFPTNSHFKAFSSQFS